MMKVPSLEMTFYDIHDQPIRVGDEVLVYVQRHIRTLVGENVYEVDQTQPLPVLDVPMARGRVEWDEDFKGLVVRYGWVCDSWEGKAASQMGGNNYAYEIL